MPHVTLRTILRRWPSSGVAPARQVVDLLTFGVLAMGDLLLGEVSDGGASIYGTFWDLPPHTVYYPSELWGSES